MPIVILNILSFVVPFFCYGAIASILTHANLLTCVTRMPKSLIQRTCIRAISWGVNTVAAVIFILAIGAAVVPDCSLFAPIAAQSTHDIVVPDPLEPPATHCLKDAVRVTDIRLDMAMAATLCLLISSMYFGRFLLKKPFAKRSDLLSRQKVIPDQTIPLVGLRLWKMSYMHKNTIWLQSWFMTTLWIPANHLQTDSPTGIHAFKNAHDLLAYADFESEEVSTVMGTVALWGNGTEYENGYTAQCAYPLELIVRDEFQAQTLRREYGCIVTVIPRSTSRYTICKHLDHLLAKHTQQQLETQKAYEHDEETHKFRIASDRSVAEDANHDNHGPF